MSLQAVLAELSTKGKSPDPDEIASYFEANAVGGYVSFGAKQTGDEGVTVPFTLLNFGHEPTPFTGHVISNDGSYSLQLDGYELTRRSAKTPLEVEMAFNPQAKEEASGRAIQSLLEKHGEEHRALIEGGVSRVASRWKEADGSITDMESFCVESLVVDQGKREELLTALEYGLQEVNGHLTEVYRSLKRYEDLYGNDFHLVNNIVAPFDPAPDITEQLFRQKVGHLALLNFEQPTLAQMLEQGENWTENDWRIARVTRAFSDRVPSNVTVLMNNASSEATNHVMGSHIHVGTLVDADGVRLFSGENSDKQTLQAHWYVRSEIKARHGVENGVAGQRALAWLLARTNDGSIPKSIMDGTATEDWNPQTNTIGGAEPGELAGLGRYETWINNFRAAQELDKHCPGQPTAIDRKFQKEREMPEYQVEGLLVSLLESSVRGDIAQFAKAKLGRELEPFDIYYTQAGETRSFEELDTAVRNRFASMDDFQAKIPDILQDLGYSREEAEFLGTRILVERCKGAGHANPAGLLGEKPWIRLSSSDGSFGWKEFDTAMHELGHAVEMVYSMYNIEHSALRGVPNTACTEAFAFLYQARAEKVLGLADDAAIEKQFAMDSVQKVIEASGIAGTSLVELYSWRWLYSNPQATPEELRNQVLDISKNVWEKYYEPHFGTDPYNILASYQHMIAFPLYVPDYFLGFVMSHQIGSYMRGKDLADETKRITTTGKVTPKLWMERAVGSDISVEPLIKDAQEGLALLGS